MGAGQPGQTIEPSSVPEQFGLENITTFFPQRAKKRIGYGFFGLATSEYPIAPDVCGVLLCTLCVGFCCVLMVR